MKLTFLLMGAFFFVVEGAAALRVTLPLPLPFFTSLAGATDL